MEITKGEELTIKFQRSEIANQLMTEIICRQMLKNNLKLDDIPREVRRYNRTFYITALRVSRSLGSERLESDFEIIMSDYKKADTKTEKDYLFSLIQDTLLMIDSENLKNENLQST